MNSVLERFRYPYLVVLGALTVFFAYHAVHLEVEEDNRSMDADNAGQILVEEELRQKFPGGDSLLVALHRDAGLLDDAGKRLISAMSAEFHAIEGVAEVTSLADSDFAITAAVEGLLISTDRTTAGFQIVLEEGSGADDARHGVIREVRAVAERHEANGATTFVSGLPVQKDESGRLIRQDQRFFAPLSFLVLGGVLLLITRRWSGVIIPLLVSLLTICWTLGIYSLCGYSLNMITSLLQPVIMTLAVMTTIHIYVEWLHRSEADNQARIVAAVKNLYGPCLFASLTTAAGFLSLLASNTPAVRQFGLFAAIGVAIAYMLGVSGLAIGLSFFKAPRRSSMGSRQPQRGLLLRSLERVSRLSLEHPTKIVLALLLVTGVSLIGLLKVRNNTDLLSFIGEESPLYQDTRFIDEHLTGVNTIELLITRSNGGKIDSYDQIRQIQLFQQAVNELPAIKHSLSAADVLDAAGATSMAPRVPFEQIAAMMPWADYLTHDLGTARITLHSKAIGTEEGAQLIDAIRATASATLGTEFKLREAGDFYRVITESNQIVANQVTSFAIAIGLILVAIGVVFRSFLFMALAIIPNVIPLLMTAGIMGFCGIELSTGTAMIASVVLGVAVDDTIHYLAAFRKSYQGNCRSAVRTTTRSTGYALTASTLALSFGFWVAIFGSFQPTVYFALLSGLTMWFALISDLLVLPACLQLALSRKESRRSDQQATPARAPEVRPMLVNS